MMLLWFDFADISYSFIACWPSVNSAYGISEQVLTLSTCLPWQIGQSLLLPPLFFSPVWKTIWAVLRAGRLELVLRTVKKMVLV